MTPGELGTLTRILPRGRSEATSIRALAWAMTLAKGSTYTDRAIREGLEQLVVEHRIPVVTLPIRDGVFVATTPAELDLGDAHLAAKAGALLRRRRALRLCREYLAYKPTLFES